MRVYVLSSVSERLPKGEFLWIALDVIRATSTIVTFFAHGGDGLYVTSSIKEAREIKKRNPEVILIGERGGVKIPGFDLDNSPTEVMEKAHLINGKRAVLTTTNGTRLLRKLLKENQKVIIGSMLNLDSAMRSALRQIDGGEFDGIAVACAGKEGYLVSDDFYCAGLMVSRLRELMSSVNLELNDTALIAESWALSNDAFDVFLNSASGRNAINHGRYKDVEFCSKINIFNLAPVATGRGEVFLENASLEKL